MTKTDELDELMRDAGGGRRRAAAMNALATELNRLSTAYRTAPRTPVTGGTRVGGMVLGSMSDFPDPTVAQREAYDAITAFGQKLDRVDPRLPMKVYDAAVDRYGYAGVHGVRFAWNGVGGWQV